MQTNLPPSFTTDEAKALRALTLSLMKFYGLDRNCMNCMNWSNGCSKANGQRPPDTVLVKGCPAWEEDDIPF